jgi:hypothetical protein
LSEAPWLLVRNGISRHGLSALDGVSLHGKGDGRMPAARL